MASTKGESGIRINYPVEEGLTAETQKQTGRSMLLKPQGWNGIKSVVETKDKLGL